MSKAKVSKMKQFFFYRCIIINHWLNSYTENDVSTNRCTSNESFPRSWFLECRDYMLCASSSYPFFWIWCHNKDISVRTLCRIHRKCAFATSPSICTICRKRCRCLDFRNTCQLQNKFVNKNSTKPMLR